MYTGCIPLGISNFGFYGKVSNHLLIQLLLLWLLLFTQGTNFDWLKRKIIVTQEGKQHILKHFAGKEIVPVQSEMRPSEGTISWMLIQVHWVSVQYHRFAYISSTKLHFYACLFEVITIIFSSLLFCLVKVILIYVCLFYIQVLSIICLIKYKLKIFCRTWMQGKRTT